MELSYSKQLGIGYYTLAFIAILLYSIEKNIYISYRRWLKRISIIFPYKGIAQYYFEE